MEGRLSGCGGCGGYVNYRIYSCIGRRGMLGEKYLKGFLRTSIREDVRGIARLAVDKGFGLGVAVGRDGAGPGAGSGDGETLERKIVA